MQCLAFDVKGGETVRLRLDAASVKALVQTLAEGYFEAATGSQSSGESPTEPAGAALQGEVSHVG